MTTVSIIIPAHNEALHLPRTLSSVHAAAVEAGIEYEVIVVDDASTDRTAEIAREHGAVVHRVALRQISAVRNAGAAKARGDVLVFLDADTMLPAPTLSAALRALEGGAAGGGAAVKFDGRIPPYARLLLPVMTLSMRLVGWAAGCFIFARREAFEATGGFDEDVYASEEIWMSLALKRQGRFVMLGRHVVTSGRKLRQYSYGEIVPLLGRLLLRGTRGVRTREGLELWYDGRRESALPDADPGSTPA